MEVGMASDIFYLRRQNYEGLKEWYAAQKEKKRQFVMFITSDGIHQYDIIKLLEVQYQSIVSQEIMTSGVDGVVQKNQNRTLDNVIAKINQKMGGVNYNIAMNLEPGDNVRNWLCDNTLLFIGFEISNPEPLSVLDIERRMNHKMPSVLGWGANCSRNPQQFIGDYVYVEPRQSDMVGSKLGELFTDIMKRHQVATSVAPRHVILYFSRISEEQFSLIADVYMRAINTSLSLLSKESKPNVTALAVSKDHNERIYKSNIHGKRAVEQNIPAGTVVDTNIVSPVINEFYLNAHSALQGTVKTPKYSLVADNSQISLDFIEGLTYGLCFLHQVVTRTVSFPVPLVVADRCAKRGHSVHIANQKNQHAPVNSIKDADDLLLNHGDLRKVRYSA